MDTLKLTCLKCGTENPTSNLVCTSCGSPIQQIREPKKERSLKKPNPAWQAYLKVIWWMNATIVIAALVPYSEVIGAIATFIIFVFQGIYVVKIAREVSSDESIPALAFKSAFYNAIITFFVSLVFLMIGMPLNLLALGVAILASVIFLMWNPIVAFIVVIAVAVIYNAATSK